MMARLALYFLAVVATELFSSGRAVADEAAVMCMPPAGRPQGATETGPLVASCSYDNDGTVIGRRIARAESDIARGRLKTYVEYQNALLYGDRVRARAEAVVDLRVNESWSGELALSMWTVGFVRADGATYRNCCGAELAPGAFSFTIEVGGRIAEVTHSFLNGSWTGPTFRADLAYSHNYIAADELLAETFRVEYLLPDSFVGKSIRISFAASSVLSFSGYIDAGATAYPRLQLPDGYTWTSSGAFLSDPVPVPSIPEPNNALLLIVGTTLIGLVVRRAGRRTRCCTCSETSTEENSLRPLSRYTG